MKERHDGSPYSLEYRALNGFPAVCEIRVYQHVGKTIVVATDVDTGPSVTNNVEAIATSLRRHGIYFDYFVEHYVERIETKREETFDWVTFTWREDVAVHAAWKAGTCEELETIIGGRFR